jgi:hypothetical protein
VRFDKQDVGDRVIDLHNRQGGSNGVVRFDQPASFFEGLSCLINEIAWIHPKLLQSAPYRCPRRHWKLPRLTFPNYSDEDVFDGRVLR